MGNYRRVNYDEIETVGGCMHFLGNPLECRNVGITIVRCEPGWRSEPHDHRKDGHEEVYVLIEGEATVVVDDEEVKMGLVDAIWISPSRLDRSRTVTKRVCSSSSARQRHSRWTPPYDGSLTPSSANQAGYSRQNY